MIATNIGSVDSGRPPECEPTVGDLVQPRSLSIGQLLVLHGLLKPAGLLPEQTFPGGEVGAFEQRVLKDALHAPEGLDHVCPVVVKVPQLPIVALVGPPERILLQDLHRREKPSRVVLGLSQEAFAGCEKKNIASE